jgi:hypothetical protein
MACEMLTPGFGGYALGLAIVGPPQNRYFTHGGPLRVNNRRLHCSIFEGGVSPSLDLLTWPFILSGR